METKHISDDQGSEQIARLCEEHPIDFQGLWEDLRVQAAEVEASEP